VKEIGQHLATLLPKLKRCIFIVYSVDPIYVGLSKRVAFISPVTVALDYTDRYNTLETIINKQKSI